MLNLSPRETRLAIRTMSDRITDRLQMIYQVTGEFGVIFDGQKTSSRSGCIGHRLNAQRE